MDIDFDIFALDDDDVTMEPPIDVNLNNKKVGDNIMPEMHCSGTDSWSSQFSSKGFIRTSFISNYHLNKLIDNTLSADCLSVYCVQLENIFDDPEFVSYLLDKACIHVQNLVNEINEQNLGNNEKKFNKTNNYAHRREVTVLLHNLLYSKLKCWPMIFLHVERLRALVNSISSIDVLKRIFNAHHTKGNACESPAHHLMHGALEWKLLDLCLLHKNWQTHQLGIEQKAGVFLIQLERVFDDLIACAVFVYLKKNTAELLYSLPFACTCFREMWFLLQLAIPQWNCYATTAPFSFWSVFNASMTNLSAKLEIFGLKELNYLEFNNWLMCALSRLAARSDFLGSSSDCPKLHHVQNYEAHEACIRDYLQTNPNEEHLRVFINILQPVMLFYMEPKIGIPTLLWEYFNKRLNENFYEIGTSPSQLSVTCSTGSAYIKRYKLLFSNLMQILSTTVPQYDANLNSFTLFILLFCKTLERLCAENPNNQHYSQKLLGRIYSKFSAQKFLQLNECGIHHTIELFLGLALCGNSHELLPKIREKLLLISLEKVNAVRQVAVSKGHTALILLHVEYCIDMTDYVMKFLHQLDIINYDLGVCRILADCIIEIFTTQSNIDFTHGEHRLIATWLPNYLGKCTQAEQDRTLEALQTIFLKINNDDKLNAEKWSHILQAFCEYLLPFVKAQFAHSFSNWLPLLAANFCTMSNPPSTCNQNEVSRLVTYFIETPTANRQAVIQFMLHVLDSKNTHEDFITDLHVLQVWLKGIVLLGHGNTEIQKLTRHLIAVRLCATLINLTTTEELATTNDPLTLFTAAVAENYEKSSNNYQQRCHIADNFNTLLQNFEKWLPITTDIFLEQQQQQPLEQYVRFHNFIATVIYNCPHIVYVKSKISCFFHIAFTRFILPTHIQMGKIPEIKYAQTIHKVWPLLVQGIGRLNYKSDAYVQKTLNDLILKWIPHFKITSNSKIVARPFITCLRHQNQELALLICEKVASNFLKTERRQANKHACLIVILFEESMYAIIADSDNEQLETLVKGIGFYVLEHMLLVDEIVPSRHMLLKLLQRLCTCSLYMNSINLKYMFAEQLRLLTRKHLAYQTFFYFDLLKQLLAISKTLVSDIWDTLMEEMHTVEQKRGVGRDQKMRDCVQQIENDLHLKKS